MSTRRHEFGGRRGFTLFEMLIVIAIMLALGAIIVVNVLPAKGQADIDLQKVQLDQIDSAMKRFKLDLNRYPSEEEGLAALNSSEGLSDEDKPNWRGPYLEGDVRKDKWNHELVYHFPSETRGAQSYDIMSWGPDGEEGTEDDITNDRNKGVGGESTKDGESFAPPADGGGSGSGGKTGG